MYQENAKRYTGNGMAGCTLADQPKQPEINQAIDSIREQIMRAAEARERISQALYRLGAPGAGIANCVGAGPCNPEPCAPTALDTLRTLAADMRYTADETHELANRLERVV